MSSRLTRTTARSFKRATALGLAMIVALAACGTSSNEAPDTGPELSDATLAKFLALPASLRETILAPGFAPISFVGRVDGTEIYIAATMSGGPAQIYLCDGQQIASWLRGTVDGSTITADDSDASVVATISADGLTGSVTVGDVGHSFTAARADFPADLWESLALADDGQLIRGGWIVLADGTQRGAVKQGVRIVSNAAIDPATGSSGSGATGTAQPSEPVPFQKKKKKKIKPPSVTAQCASLAITLDLLLTVAGNEVGPGGTVSDAGVAAAEQAALVSDKMDALGCAAALAALGAAIE
jgi:hypothetical protein